MWTIPLWFIENNIKINAHATPQSTNLEDVLHGTDANAEDKAQARDTDVQSSLVPRVCDGQIEFPQVKTPGSGGISEQPFKTEIWACVRAGLSSISPQSSPQAPALQPNLDLVTSTDGGYYRLGRMVEGIAWFERADVISLEAQDLTELAEPIIATLASSPTNNALRSLGYDVHTRLQGKQFNESEEDVDEDDEGMDEDDDMPATSQGRPVFSRITAIPMSSVRGGSFRDTIEKALNQHGAFFGPRSSEHGRDVDEAWARFSTFLQALVDPRSRQQENSEVDQSLTGDSAIPAPETSKTIILIRDYRRIRDLPIGARILDRLAEIVQQNRGLGHRVMIVGTTASSELSEESVSKDSLVSDYRTFKAIVVEPGTTEEAKKSSREDRLQRVFEVNMRHIRHMLNVMDRSSTDIQQKDQVENSFKHFRSLQGARVTEYTPKEGTYADPLMQQAWSYQFVHHLASLAIGIKPETNQQISSRTLVAAFLAAQDSEKLFWDPITSESKDSREASSQAPETTKRFRRQPSTTFEHSPDPSFDPLKKIRKNLNKHEKRLLNGVINPSSITTTFSTVHAPLQTIEALKTLTSLSLVRPEAFRYGVLASDKIPGLLMYGPPGTGKTLLAKAVAKESGATMLEVSGADIYDMYVGEGEKNVKAVFSLAKKLTAEGKPCIVFIDEADAIFGSRGGGSNRSSHRELINQFLKEWDGMHDMSAFIMVATNRPFDLDDAVLRRLPRRLLVDLPVEKDREAILRIHLRDEVLDDEVSLARLARQTPLYSGSDLKNLSVAAALSAVREENDIAAKHTAEHGGDGNSSEPYRYPEKRTLENRHFDRAMEEISASVSEDMSSLTAIRKFDEKYGDRKGRRKKSGMGFAAKEGVVEEDARVRT